MTGLAIAVVMVVSYFIGRLILEFFKIDHMRTRRSLRTPWKVFLLGQIRGIRPMSE